jgi:hypothetical protein
MVAEQVILQLALAHGAKVLPRLIKERKRTIRKNMLSMNE